MKKVIALAVLVGGGVLFVGVGQSADHIDSPAAVADPTADINDFYAWPNMKGTKLNLIMTINPFATTETKWSTANQYIFHVNSGADHANANTETQVLCKFYKEDGIECWAGDSYVVGDPSAAGGITSEDGKLKVFAGLRNDPFFMEFNGFTKVSEDVRAFIDANGVPAVDANSCSSLVTALGTTADDLVTQLGMGYDTENMTQVAASDTFNGANVMALAVQIDKTLVNSGGDKFKVWASTNK